ncbi:MAG: phage tail tape measure protein, partial [Rikenellaceae bacterium]
MANKIEYIFSLQDKISAKLGGITATSDKTAATLSGVRDKVSTVNAIFNDTGRTIGSLKMKIDALQTEKEWIPADNLAAIKEYNKQINHLSKEINDLEVASSGGKFRNWAKDAFRSLPGAEFITNPLVAATAGLGFAGKTAMNFEKNIAAINVTAQLDEKGVAEMSDKIREITKKNSADIRIAPVGFEKIISQTGDLEMSYDIFNSTQQAARTGLVDMDTAAGALAQTMSVIGKENANASEVLDVFFAAKRVGAGEFQDFARYMPGLIAGAKNMGIAYKEVAGTFAYMTGKGQTAERAAVLMENAFSVLGRGEVRDKLSLAGVDVFDQAGKVRSLVDVFGDLQGVMSSMNDEQKSTFLEGLGVVDKEAKNAFSILTSDVDKFNSSMREVSDSTGATDQALEFSNSTTRKATEVWNSLVMVGERIGTVILPIIVAGLSALDVVLSGVSAILDLTISLFGGWCQYLSDGNPLIWALTAALGAYTIAMGVNYAITQKSVIISGIKKIADIASTAVTWGLTAAQTALNAAFYAS